MNELQRTFPLTDVWEGTVDEDGVVAFALATNSANCRYLGGRAVPPLYTAALVLDCERESEHAGMHQYEVTGATVSVHGEQDVYFHRPVRPGMRLRWSGVTFSARQTKGGVLVIQRITVTDEEGSLLVEHFWGTFHSHATINTELGPVAPIHTFPEEARFHPYGMKAVHIDRDQGFRYAGASGDRVGHAISDEQARLEGYPGKILQGMCTFGIATGALVDLVAGGDPDRLRRLAVRFSRPAFPCKDLEVHVFDAGRTDAGRTDAGRTDAGRTDAGDLAFAFEGVQAGITVLKHGRVEVSPR
jgi:acyl dehydratase